MYIQLLMERNSIDNHACGLIYFPDIFTVSCAQVYKEVLKTSLTDHEPLIKKIKLKKKLFVHLVRFWEVYSAENFSAPPCKYLPFYVEFDGSLISEEMMMHTELHTQVRKA